MINITDTNVTIMVKDMEAAIHFYDGKSGNYLHFADPDGTILYFVQPKW